MSLDYEWIQTREGVLRSSRSLHLRQFEMKSRCVIGGENVCKFMNRRLLKAGGKTWLTAPGYIDPSYGGSSKYARATCVSAQDHTLWRIAYGPPDATVAVVSLMSNICFGSAATGSNSGSPLWRGFDETKKRILRIRLRSDVLFQ